MATTDINSMNAGGTVAGVRHIITWRWGENVSIAFNSGTDVLDLGWLTPSNFTVSEVNGSVVIALPSNNQSYTLTGISLTDLSAQNIAAYDSQTTHLWQGLMTPAGGDGESDEDGVDSEDDGDPSDGDQGSGPDASDGNAEDGDTGESGDGSGSDSGGTPETPADGDQTGNGQGATQSGSFVVSWSWGQYAVVDFDPETDVIDFGWMGGDHFSIAEINGEVVISVSGNQQTYTLQAVGLSDLSIENIRVLDASARDKWESVLGATDPGEDHGSGSGSGSGDEGGSGDHDGGSDGSTGHHDHMHVVIAADSGPRIIHGFMPAMGDVIEIRPDVTAENFSLFEESGDALGQTVRIELLNNGMTSQIVLTGIGLADLSLGNFSFGNEGVLNEVSAILGSVTGDGSSGGSGNGSDEGSGNGSGGGSDGSSGQTPGQGSGYPLIRDTDGSNPPQTTGVTVNGGVKYRADTNADDIVGFRPGVDELDFGSVSVHGMILTKSDAGEVVIVSPWSPAAQIVQGVKFEDITIEDLGVVGNEHLRQDIGGVMSWEQGVGPMDADTVYVRSHEYGRHEVIEGFDPSYMKISFLYFGTRERLSVEDTDAGLVISSMPTGQSFTFTGVSKADLVPGLVEFHFDQVIEDNLEVPFGFSQDAVTLVDRTVLLTPLAPDGASTDGFQVRTGDLTGSIYDELWLGPDTDEDSGVDASDGGEGGVDGSEIDPVDNTDTDETAPPGGSTHPGDSDEDESTAPGSGDGHGGNDSGLGTDWDGSGGAVTDQPSGNGKADVFSIDWSYGEHKVLAFDPELDVLDFGWMNAESIELSEVEGSVVISVVSNNQSYTLKDVAAEDLTATNIQAHDPMVMTEWSGFADWA